MCCIYTAAAVDSQSIDELRIRVGGRSTRLPRWLPLETALTQFNYTPAGSVRLGSAGEECFISSVHLNHIDGIVRDELDVRLTGEWQYPIYLHFVSKHTSLRAV